jgi:hypothetical protein
METGTGIEPAFPNFPGPAPYLLATPSLAAAFTMRFGGRVVDLAVVGEAGFAPAIPWKGRIDSPVRLLIPPLPHPLLISRLSGAVYCRFRKGRK